MSPRRCRSGRRIAFIAALSATLAACRSEAPVAPTSQAASAPAAVKIALLHPGRENDGGWNQLAYDALLALRDSTGATVQHTHTPNRSAFKAELRDYGQRGFTLVICHGSEFSKAAREVARDFPRTKFLVTGSADAGDGVATLDFRLWEATYLCGVLAAKLMPQGPAGLIGGEDIVTVRKTMDAFANGAHSIEPRYTIFPQYVGSWDDVAKAQQTARSLIETRGVTVIYQNCDAAAEGVFRAAASAGVLAFGANSDQSRLAPNAIPASAVIDMQDAFRLVLESIRLNRWEDRAIPCDLRSGVIRVALNPAFKTRWPADALPAMERARAAIISGKLDVLAAP